MGKKKKCIKNKSPGKNSKKKIKKGNKRKKEQMK